MHIFSAFFRDNGFAEGARIVDEARQGRARARQQEANGRIVQQLSPLQAKALFIFDFT